MSNLDALRHRLHALLRRGRHARELDEEIRFHLALEEMHQHHAGAAEDEARFASRRRFGNLTYLKEEVRRATGLGVLDRIHQDLAYAIRGLRRSPGFTGTIVLTLALGLGANAAMFSLLDPLFLRAPAGVVDAGEVRRLYARVHFSTGWDVWDRFTYQQYTAVRAEIGGAAQVAGFSNWDSVSVGDGEHVTPAWPSYVEADFFSLLGVRPQLGRFFMPNDDRMGAGRAVVVLGDALWRDAFGADPGVVGRTIHVGDRVFTVVGIAPPDFTGVDVEPVQLWMPLSMLPFDPHGGPPWYEDAGAPFVRALARPAHGIGARTIAAAGTVAYRRIQLAGVSHPGTSSILTGPLLRARGPAERPHEQSIALRLAGVALIVLMVACANVANLLLVRATRRRREIAVRLALGVSRARLCGQLLIESLVLATLGGGVAVLVAAWGAAALRGALLTRIRWTGSVIDLRVLAFLLGAALVTGVLAGLAPALHASRPELTTALKSGVRDGVYQKSRLRSALLVCQAALSVVLLVGAGLFVRSLRNVHAIDLGYDAEQLVFASPNFGAARPRSAVIRPIMEQAAARLGSAPGVRGVALSSAVPMNLNYGWVALFVPGRDSLPSFGGEPATRISVSPGYFRTTGMRIERGRAFTLRDGPNAQPVVVVNETMARAFWPGESAVGKCLILGQRTNPCHTVVGVVSDAHRDHVIEKPIGQYYLPLRQRAGVSWVLILRTPPSHAVAVGELARRELQRLVPGAHRIEVQRMTDVLAPQLRPWRLGAELFTAFGMLALVVAAVGVYSVVAYTFSQRTHEIGVRVALGAHTKDVLRLVLGAGMRVAVVGVVLGVVLALMLGRLVSSLLYGISASDPLVIGGAASLMLAIGVAASIVPGWRAARVDPVTALRAE